MAKLGFDVADRLVSLEKQARIGVAEVVRPPFASPLRLLAHPRKTRVFRVKDGLTFLGWRIFPDRTGLVRLNVVRFRRRLRWIRRQYTAGRLDHPAIRHRLHAWLGHAGRGDTVAAPAFDARICYLRARCGAIGPGGSRRVLEQQRAESAGL